MQPFDLTTVFVTFFAVFGPPKVLLSFARVARTRSEAELRRLAWVSSLIAAVIGVVMAYTADFVTTFFHVTDQSLQLAGGVIFFVYSLTLVLGMHLGGGTDDSVGHREGRLAEGLRELMLPYVASPLAVTAVLVGALTKDSWGWRTTMAGAYAAVAAIDCLCVLLLARVLKSTHQTSLEVLSRLLGLILAAVGVELFLGGLHALGVHLAPAAH
ncbi:MarC family protein [Streptomyces sp. NPDC057565]|uniref:MarC family protein n=1 Tax=Streptomyces sp. NPDC057565 TaxID=3346169 RepID=UPI0036B3F752